MLFLSNKFLNVAVVSINAGAKVGTVTEMIINPHKLRVDAFYVISRATGKSVLHVEDIRGYGPQGLLIDHEEQLMDLADLVRLQEIAKIRYTLIDKKVVTEDKQKLGKVTDFVIDSETFKIMKIHVRQSVLKNLQSSALVIDRSQIVELTNDKIIVKSTAIKEQEGSVLKANMPLPSIKPQLNPDPAPSKLSRS